MFFRRSGAGTNPLTINEYPTANSAGIIVPGNNITTGKTQRGSNLLTPGQKTLVILVIGTSIESNASGADYTVTNTATNDNHNIYDGNIWGYLDPYLGPSFAASRGSYPGVIGDVLINDGTVFNRTVTIGCAMGGSSSADWARSGAFSHRIVAAILQARKCLSAVRI